MTLRRRPRRRTRAPWATGVVAVLVGGAALAGIAPELVEGPTRDPVGRSLGVDVGDADLDDGRPGNPPKGVRRGAHRPTRAVQVGLLSSSRHRGRQIVVAAAGGPPDDAPRIGERVSVRVPRSVDTAFIPCVHRPADRPGGRREGS